MTLPFTLPDWVPWWVPLVVMIPALLYALAFLFMPFSVIGLKGRMDVLEARMDEIHHELRLLILRLPEVGGHVDYDEIYHPETTSEAVRRAPVVTRPPIPPAAHELGSGHGDADRPPPPPNTRPSRREPRLDWPR
jgi:hypothetical protein